MVVCGDSTKNLGVFFIKNHAEKNEISAINHGDLPPLNEEITSNVIGSTMGI
jgi:hypothetical protein